MKRVVALLLLALLLACPALGEGRVFGYRFADADEAAALLLGNRDYFESLNQMNLDYRAQKRGATLGELEAFVAAQARDFTDAERAGIDAAMADIEDVCAERGYALPETDGIVFARTTMQEAYGMYGYTLGTQIYLNPEKMTVGKPGTARNERSFRLGVAHELFHCLTRKYPDFRAAMYRVLGFTVADAEFVFPPSLAERICVNPDVERHDAYAAFEIGGEMRDCVLVLTIDRPFERPGDRLAENVSVGLVPVDDLATVFAPDDAANFWEVFGRNTKYVIDPEEALADNFALTLVDGPDGDFKSPEIIAAIDACLKSL